MDKWPWLVFTKQRPLSVLDEGGGVSLLALKFEIHLEMRKY